MRTCTENSIITVQKVARRVFRHAAFVHAHCKLKICKIYSSAAAHAGVKWITFMNSARVLWWCCTVHPARRAMRFLRTDLCTDVEAATPLFMVAALLPRMSCRAHVSSDGHRLWAYGNQNYMTRSQPETEVAQDVQSSCQNCDGHHLRSL